MIERAREDIAGERERAIAEIRREVGTLAVDLAGRVIGESLDRDRQLSLVDRYIDELAPGGGSGSNR
jgi:F-type H+-transporting ATPase subunit b